MLLDACAVPHRNVNGTDKFRLGFESLIRASRNGLGSLMMSSIWIIVGVWICLNLAFVAMRLLVTARNDDQAWTWGIQVGGARRTDVQE